MISVFSQVNNVDFGHFTREEAANFLLNIGKGEQVQISTQHKMDSESITRIMPRINRESWGQT